MEEDPQNKHHCFIGDLNKNTLECDSDGFHSVSLCATKSHIYSLPSVNE